MRTTAITACSFMLVGCALFRPQQQNGSPANPAAPQTSVFPANALAPVTNTVDLGPTSSSNRCELPSTSYSPCNHAPSPPCDGTCENSCPTPPEPVFETTPFSAEPIDFVCNEVTANPLNLSSANGNGFGCATMMSAGLFWFPGWNGNTGYDPIPFTRPMGQRESFGSIQHDEIKLTKELNPASQSKLEKLVDDFSGHGGTHLEERANYGPDSHESSSHELFLHDAASNSRK